MIAIGNVKWGVRLEPIYMQELSNEETNAILEQHGVHLNEHIEYPIDTRIISIFRTDEQKLSEYISICKYEYDRKNGKNVQKPKTNALSIFDSNLQINFELRDLKQSEVMNIADKVRVYKKAKELQSIFRKYGSKNVNIDMSILDRAYFEVQGLIQTIKSKKSVPVLSSGNETREEGTFRKEFFDKAAQHATDEVAKQWQEQDKEILSQEMIDEKEVKQI